MSFRLFSLVRVSALCAAILAVGASLASGQTPAAKPCAGGGTYRFSAVSAIQGTPLTLEVTLPKGAANPSSEWNARAVPVWQVANKPGVYRGLLGIDLETEAGAYPWKLTATSAAGAAITCEDKITVRSAKFPTERLTVDKQYVEPNPDQEKRAEEEGKKMRAIYDTVTPEKLWQGAFIVPLKGVSTGGNFGRKRVLNGKPRSPHTGIDFPAATGTPVFAAQSGKVALAEGFYYPGNTILIDHGLGVFTFYGHLSEIAVKPGQLVKVGELIGKVGATGRVTGPHLHWGVTIDKARVNGLALTKLRP